MKRNKREKMAFDSQDEALGMIWKRVDEALKKSELSDDLKKRTGMVLDELLTNICAYGRGDDPDADSVVIQVGFEVEEPDSIRLIIKDTGIPFNPLTVTASKTDLSEEEDGMGLRLVREWSDDLHYEYRDEQNHLEVLLRTREG